MRHDLFPYDDDGVGAPGSDGLAQMLRGGTQLRVGTDLSLRKLQIFWAVVHTGSFTRAAKLLSLAQPTVSQQLASLETSMGNKLFARVNNTLVPTEFGIAFTRHAENVLRAAQELEDMVAEFGKGQMQTVRVAGVPSALRALLPPSIRALRQDLPMIDFDMHEGSPAEVLEMLYARRINLALLPKNSLGDLSTGFSAFPLISDPYVLVVPEAYDLGALTDPDAELDADANALLHQTIQFSFGNQHSRRVQHWFDTVFPGNRVVARARSFDLMVEMVRNDFGICVAPALSAATDGAQLKGVRLYQLDLPSREVVAIVPSHYHRVTPYAPLLQALQNVAENLTLPPLLPQPRFIADRMGQ